jgi:hypothetical protein
MSPTSNSGERSLYYSIFFSSHPFIDHTPVHCAASHLIMDVDMKIKDDLDKEKDRGYDRDRDGDRDRDSRRERDRDGDRDKDRDRDRRDSGMPFPSYLSPCYR